MSYIDELLKSARLGINQFGNDLLLGTKPIRDAVYDTGKMIYDMPVGALTTAGSLLGEGMDSLRDARLPSPTRALIDSQASFAQADLPSTGREYVRGAMDAVPGFSPLMDNYVTPGVMRGANAVWNATPNQLKAGAAGVGALGLMGLNMLGPWAPEAEFLTPEQAYLQSKGVLGAMGGGKKPPRGPAVEPPAPLAPPENLPPPVSVQPPQSTVKAYKLFNQDKDGNLWPLYINPDNAPFPQGQWIDAKMGESLPSGKVKADGMSGGLAMRPGLHAGDTPAATHIGGRFEGDTSPAYRLPNQVWAEVEMPSDVDWQSIANSRARIGKNGEPVASTAHITDQLPVGGFYRYKTNPNMQGDWLIGGGMKINRVLSNDEVAALNAQRGVSDLPRIDDLLQADPSLYDRLPKSTKKLVSRPAPQEAAAMNATQGADASPAANPNLNLLLSNPTVKLADANSPVPTYSGALNESGTITPAQVNIGMDVGTQKDALTEKQITKVLRSVGVEPLDPVIMPSDTENTFVSRLSRPLTQAEAHKVSAALNQDAIAQKAPGASWLAGPKAHEWNNGEFNPDYWREHPNGSETLPMHDPVAQIPGYPEIAPPMIGYDEKKKQIYWARGESADTKAFEKARDAAQKDINAGNYTPMFDVSKRYYADPSKHPTTESTIIDAAAKQQKTRDKWDAEINTPKARQSLLDAYKVGVTNPKNGKWYAMGQLADQYENELGAELGAKRFKEDFADAMAATTGGAAPTGNLLMGHFGNYAKELGIPAPTRGYAAPVPIGGRYFGGNMELYNKVNSGSPLTAADHPKRFNFSRNFLGDLRAPTIDEQMTQLMTPGKNAPPAGSYPSYEKTVNQVAKEIGIENPAELQDIVWGGKKDAKGNYEPTPMIQTVNEAIERTARLTGKTPQQVLKDFIHRKGPLFGFGLAAVGGGLLSRPDSQQGL